MDPRPIELHPRAVAEAREARQWYEQRSSAAAAAFIAELDAAIDHICGAPDRWPTYLQGTRRYLLKRFPYVVVIGKPLPPFRSSPSPMASAGQGIGIGV